MVDSHFRKGGFLMANVDNAPVAAVQDWKNNRLRARLDAGEYVVGLTITSSNLETAVLGAKLGFHFLWVEMEHSPVSLETLRGIVLATQGLEAAVLARVPVV
jgi:2-keto-3-deoxy-L-rhamnonate aldolase RhmA